MKFTDPYWTSPQQGHDWRDEDVLRAVAWSKSFVSSQEMENRLESAQTFFLAAALPRLLSGEMSPLHDPSDKIAWYLFQSETFAINRNFWVPSAVASIVPLMARLGKEIDLLKNIGGVETRAARLMCAERRQPDGGLFEFLVALAYRRGGWSVDFVPEMPGVERTPDLHVSRTRRRWAVECKRLMPSNYAAQEKAHGVELSKPVHALSLELGRSIIVDAAFKVELKDVPKDFLVRKVEELVGQTNAAWDDEICHGTVRDVDWTLTHHVLSSDNVYFGSSRMIELLTGHYRHEAEYCMKAKWRAAAEHPFYADAIYHASVVSWVSHSLAAQTRKARHFKSTLANAEDQLPSDRPGAIHVGVESWAGAEVDAMRHIQNFVEARLFQPDKSRLRWVYGNYFVPELTTNPGESWAITETMVPYKIGHHSITWPLPGHMLIVNEEDQITGVHWDRSN